MKRFLTPAATFNPTAGTLDLSAITGFDIRRLAAVFDLKTQAMIYGPVAGFGASAVAGGVLTLQASLAGLGGGDQLLVIYDDATGKVAEDASVQSVLAAINTLISDVVNNHADLGQLHTDLTGTLHADLAAIATKLGTSPAQSSDVAAVVSRLGASPAQSGDVASVVSRLGAAPAQTADITALGVILQSLLTVAQAQRSETLCTDNTGAYFVRVEKAGVLTWTDLLGNTATPGAGLAPAAGTDLITTADPYRALNSGTGYIAGDIIRHVLTQNPTTGAIAGQFWLNATQSTKIAAPPGGDLQLIDPQAEGAATLAAQLAGNTILSALQTALATLHTDAQTQHSDLVALHTDSGTTLHADLQALAAALGTTGDLATTLTLVGLLKAIKASLAGTLVTKSASPTPVASPGYVASLAAKVGACTAVNIHASNASQAVEGYLVAIDAAAVPAAGAAITPLKKRRLPTNDGTIDGTAEIDTPFAVQNGLVVLLTTSLTAFVPGALTGVIDASTLA